MNNNKTTTSFFFLFLIVLLTFIYITVIYFIMDPTTLPFMEAKINMSELSFETWRAFFYPHIVLGIISLAVGPFLLMDSSRKTIKLHKNLGIIYVSAIFINALVVPFLAIYSTGGLPSTVAFFSLDAVWLGTTWVSVWRMAQGKFPRHREWMMRSYAITMVFVTFRLLVTLLGIMFPEQTAMTYPLSISAAMVINLVVAEIMIRKSRGEVPVKANITA